jgi:hypothetical protein
MINSYQKWKSVYQNHLEEMYKIFFEKASKLFPEKINYFESEKSFENFCKKIYSKSSKHITFFI